MAFEFDGAKYRQASAHQKEWGDRLIARASLRGNERILDLGCGDGVLTARLGALVPQGSVLGIDASEGMLTEARQFSGENVDFAVLNIEHMAFQEEFDVIYSNAALHWVKDHRRLLAAAHAALRPGGKALWNFAAEGTCSVFFSVIRKIIAKEVYAPYFRDFSWPWYMPSRDAYLELLRDSPFREYEVREEIVDRYFDEWEQMAAWMDQPTLVPFAVRVPAKLKEKFRDETADELRKASALPDDRHFETFRRLAVTARK